MSSEALIHVEHVSKKFCRSLRKSLQYGIQDIAAELVGRAQGTRLRPGEFFAVHDVSFALRRGECLGLVGKNGAGKTTLLKMLNGLIKPDAGLIRVRGRVGGLIALGAGFNPLLSGRENIFVNGSILGMSRAEIEAKLERIIDFAELREFIDAPVQSYSSGMVVRLGFAVAVHCELDSLLLDEVLAVGDTAFQAKCYNTLGNLREQGIGFVLVSHNLSAIECFCDRVLYLKKGQCVLVDATRAALAEYNRDMLSDSQPAPPAPRAGPEQRACGTGAVVIKRLAFLDEGGSETAEITAGAPVTLRLEYECTASEPVSVVIDIHIKDQAGVFYHEPRAAIGPNLRGRGRIDVRFASIPANNQRLLFSIALTGLASWELYDWKCDVPLTVHGSPGSQGRVHLRLKAEVIQESANPAPVVGPAR